MKSGRYEDICKAVAAAGGYLTDPVGKCLRTTTPRKKPRIDLDYKGSETYAAFERREDLSLRFDLRRAKEAHLIWVNVPTTGAKSDPYPVLVDRGSGIIQGSMADGSKGYAYFADVQGCIYYTLPNA